MKEFKLVSGKKYAIRNSYFKNAHGDMPKDPYEVLAYYKQWNELPYKTDILNSVYTEQGDIFYECFIEYQKRNGVHMSQYFTPPSVADQFVAMSGMFFEPHGLVADEQADYVNNTILDACCGFGILGERIRRDNHLSVNIAAFDIDERFEPFVKSAGGLFFTRDFRELKRKNEFKDAGFKFVVSNPPYEINELIDFLSCLPQWLIDTGRAILLLPVGFIDKTGPKKILEVMSEFTVLHREPADVPFARTGTRAEIVVIEKMK